MFFKRIYSNDFRDSQLYERLFLGYRLAMVLYALLALLLLLVTASGAYAQTVPPTPPGSSTLAPGTVPVIAVTNASSSPVALPGSTQAFPVVTLLNSGAKDAFCALGGSGVTATTSAVPVRSGTRIAYWVGTGTYIACITGGTDTTTITVYQATGPV